ncbi:MAG: hypothetical protein KDC98_12965 [Planctomycetes bacterium]|nr:hypothetical protein [Planctomycetota bacterium]
MNPSPLWAWMRERHAIYHRRAAGQPRPWTSDPILQRHRFCNVFRELDKVTVWIRENVREPFAEHEYLWLMLAIARTINHPETLTELVATPGAWPFDETFDVELLAAVLQRRIDAGLPCYTGAYMIRAENDPRQACYHWTKQQYVARIVIGKLWEVREQIDAQLSWTKRLQDAQRVLTPFRGWGPFMSYEVVTDLRHTRYLRAATDTMTWASAGPGALRGLNRLQGRPLGSKRSPGDACVAMRALLEQAASNLPPDFPALEMRDIEHSLCEVDKYLRVLNGEGKPRSSFSGTVN